MAFLGLKFNQYANLIYKLMTKDTQYQMQIYNHRIISLSFPVENDISRIKFHVKGGINE